MEKIQRYCSKRNLYIGTIVRGIVGAILFIIAINIENTITSMKTISELDAFYSELNGLISVIKNFCNIYYLNFVLLLVATGTYGIRLLKSKDQTIDTKIFLGVNVGMLLLCVISFNTISTIKAVSSGQLSNAFGLGDIGELKLVFFMLLLQVASACYAGFLLFKNKGTQEVDTASAPTQANTSNTNAESASEPKSSIIEKFKAYYLTSSGKKNVRVGGAVIVVILIAFIGLSVFNSMKRTPIDLTKNCQVSFEGISGEGQANITCKADYDVNNVEIAAFVNSITYEVENNGSLKNGDTIQIKANYSEPTAESLKLKPENTTMKAEVKDLSVAYKKFDDIPKSKSSKFEENIKLALEESLKKGSTGFTAKPKSISIDGMDCIATYYKYSSSYNSGTAYYIFRVKEAKEYSGNIQKQINYYYAYVENINSNGDVSFDNIHYDSIIDLDDKGKTDKEMLDSFKKSHNDVDIVEENPTTLTYSNEIIMTE